MRRPLAVFSGLFIALTLVESWAKPLWFDELFSVYICRLPASSDFWSALRNGPELNPPLHYLAVRASMRVLGEGAFGARAPSVLACWIGCGCVFLVTSRRGRTAPAFAAALFPMITAVRRYAIVARPYAFLWAGAGVALLCWQRAAEERPRVRYLVGLSFGLAFALLSHCYAVLLFLPLAAGEAVRTWRKRRLDLAVWLAIAAPFLLVITYRPLFAASRALAQHTWAAPTLGRLAETYVLLVHPLLWVVVAAGVVVATHQGATPSPGRPWFAAPAEEVVALIVLAGLPIAVFAAAVVVTGFYDFRYAAPSAAGLSILLALFVGARSSPKRREWGPAVAIAACWAVTTGWLLADRIREAPEASAAITERCGVAESDLPVAVSDGHLFLPLLYYGPVQQRARLVYLLDPELAARHTGNNSVDLGLAALSRVVPLPLEDYRTFVARHRQFLVYGSRRARMGWLMHEVEASGAQIEATDRCRESLFRVTMP